MQDGVIPLFSRSRLQTSEKKEGWSNQDLAELYRIEAALVQAGIAIDTELGETDEGEPWFAFCRADTGDVLIHVAIIDGQYHIAGASSSVLVKGYSFTDIVRQFMSREPAFLLGTSRHNNVMIHPSSVLIAVFAAICLISDEYNQELVAFSAHEKGLANLAGRPEAETYNVVDQRHITLGEYTFSPQQVFIILSAIAFSTSPIVQNKNLGIEAAFGVFDLIESGSPDPEWTVEKFVADLWDERFAPAEPGEEASKEIAQVQSDQQLERVETNTEVAELQFAPELPSSEYNEEGEARRSDSTYDVAGEDSTMVEDQPVQTEQEIVLETETGGEAEPPAVVAIAVPTTAYEFFESNAVITDASQDIVFMIDAIDAMDGLGALNSDVVYTSESQLDTISPTSTSALEVADTGGMIDLDTTEIGAVVVPEIAPVLPAPNALEIAGFDTGAMSDKTYHEISHYFDLFTDSFGAAEASFDRGRWLIKNEAANEYGWYSDRASDPIVHRVFLDDGTKVFFMGIQDDPDYDYAVA